MTNGGQLPEVSTLENLRKMIEVFDRDLIQTIAQRLEVARQIGIEKKKEGIAIEDASREEALHALHAQWAGEFGVDESVVSAVFEAIIRYSKSIQSR